MVTVMNTPRAVTVMPERTRSKAANSTQTTELALIAAVAVMAIAVVLLAAANLYFAS